MVWYLVLNSSPDPGSIDDSRFVTCLTIFVDWLSFCLLIYHQTLQGILLPYSPFTLPPAKWTQLWSLKTLTEARTLCFRFIYQKVRCQESVSQSNPDISAACTLCYALMENINHLMPLKANLGPTAPRKFISSSSVTLNLNCRSSASATSAPTYISIINGPLVPSTPLTYITGSSDCSVTYTVPPSYRHLDLDFLSALHGEFPFGIGFAVQHKEDSNSLSVEIGLASDSYYYGIFFGYCLSPKNKISFATLSLPRSQGGLGALDLAVQIQELQWRWLLPMALSCSPSIPIDSLFPSHNSSALPKPSNYQCLFTTIPNLQIQTLHCFSILFTAFGSLICRAFDDDAILSPTTILTLPLT
ncbi:hypothetical protein G6F37_012162 [Rhizopus arrhizus]|nr:hypothetical protein G6F38_012205 [Rhizopus arrhizus]KAG1145323.1 hypothetical protein G6F37_012162 [Rhizopus arrhizus]